MATKPQALPPVIEELKVLIENDPEVNMLFNKMFEQLPRRPPYDKTSMGQPRGRGGMGRRAGPAVIVRLLP